MTVTLSLLPEVVQILQAKALRNGTTLESYLAGLAEQDAPDFPERHRLGSPRALA